MVRYAMIFLARSGSTYLTELLSSHPDVHAEEESFAGFIQWAKKREWSMTEVGERQLQWAEHYFSRAPETDVRAWGFKTKFNDIVDKNGFGRIVRDRDVRILVLLRRNQVKSVVSLMNAVRLKEQTGDWNLRDPARQESSPLFVDPEVFARWLEGYASGIAAVRTYVRDLSQSVLEIEYEGLLTKPQETLERLCSFLEVRCMPMQASTHKNTNDDLRNVVENFDHLRARYVGTPYGAMFDEVLVPPEPDHSEG